MKTEHLSRLGLTVNNLSRLSYLPGYQTSPRVCRIMYIRHGETYGNRAGVYQGKSDVTNETGTGLNQLRPEGIAQAQLASDKLIQAMQEGWCPDVILVSPLSRARTTTEIFINKSQIKLPPVIEPELAEIDFGEWDNKRIGEMSSTDKEDAKAYLNYNAIIKSATGESFVDLVLRAEKVLQKWESLYSGKDLLVFGHGTWGNALRIVLHLLPQNNGYLEYCQHKDMLPYATPVRLI